MPPTGQTAPGSYGKEPASNPSTGTPTSTVNEPSQVEKEGYTLNSKVIEVTDTSVLLANMGENTAAGDLYFVSIKDVPIYDKDGQAINSEELKAGMMIDVYYDGSILETYPSRVANVSSIYITEEDYDMVGFYMDLVQDIYEDDEALNADINKIVLDLTKTDNITTSEKYALAYLVGNEYSVESFLSTYEQLKEDGYLAEDYLYFPDGILITIESSEVKKDKFTFSIDKWRSGLGAIGYSDCEAHYKDGQWTYTIGANWIS